MSNDILDGLLSAQEPEENKSNLKEFKPIFNVREEFPIWVREQFPKLGKHAKKGKVYEALEARKDEVYKAALGAVNHGVTSTDACATARLGSGWGEFEEGFGEGGNPEKRAKSLEKFVEAIEDLSVSLGGNPHYTEAGNFISGRGYRKGSINAWVYRVGGKEDNHCKFIVFEKEQKFSGADAPELIGELTQLESWDLKQLKMTASKFRGNEIAFIEEVDRWIPEEGSYAYSRYGSGGGTRYGNYGGYSGNYLSHGATPLKVATANTLPINKSDAKEKEIQLELIRGRGKRR